MQRVVRYGFGPYSLETETQLLHRHNQAIRLQPKVYELLLYFLQHSGRLISREELLQQVWCGRIVEDTALRLAINTLRHVLDDDSKTPAYILTVCRRGYRFLPDVRIEAEGMPETIPIARKTTLPAPESETQQLVQLLDAFTQASAGTRTLVFLNGARQTGKTALLEQFVDLIGQTGPAVLRARCVQLGGVLEPYLPLLEALERRCLKPGSGLLMDSLYRIAPSWLYQLSNLLEPGDLAALIPKVAQTGTGRMLREGARFFERLGSERLSC